MTFEIVSQSAISVEKLHHLRVLFFLLLFFGLMFKYFNAEHIKVFLFLVVVSVLGLRLEGDRDKKKKKKVMPNNRPK